MGRHYEQGVALFNLKRYREAVDAFSEDLLENPESALTLAMRAASWLNCGEVKDAERDVANALRVNPNCGYAHYILSCVHTNYGRSPKAEAAAREAIRFELRAVYFFRLAEVYFLRGMFRECQSILDEGLSVDPTHASCLMLQAKCLSALGRRHEAEDCLRRLLSQNPENPAAHQALGNLTLKVGEASEARDLLQEARRLSPVTHNDRYALATSYGRTLWPLRLLNKCIVRFHNWSISRRWLFLATMATMPEIIAGVFRPPAYITMVLFLTAYNLILTPLTFELCALVLGRIAFRKDLDLPWYHTPADLMGILACIVWHTILSALAIKSANEPAFSTIVLFFAINFELFVMATRRGRIGVPLIVLSVIGGFIPILMSCAFLNDPKTWPTAMACWLVALIFSYILTIFG